MLGFGALGEFALGEFSGGPTAEIDASYGAYVLSGQDAAFLVHRVLVGDVGSYALTGQDVTLDRIRGLAGGAEVGSFTLTGQAVSLIRDRRLRSDAGSFTLTGQVLRYEIRAAPHRRITGTGFRFALDDTITSGH